MVRSKWLARRRRGITATDVAAILGMSKYATPLDVYLTKRDGDQKEANYAMQRGNALEPLLIDEWHARNPDAERLVTPALVAHPENRWAMASLDHVARIDGTQTPWKSRLPGGGNATTGGTRRDSSPTFTPCKRCGSCTSPGWTAPRSSLMWPEMCAF